MKVGNWVIWDGAADRLIGRVTQLGVFGKAEVQRLDGTTVTIEENRLRPCSLDYVDWAIWLGGCTVPKTGKPPINCKRG